MVFYQMGCIERVPIFTRVGLNRLYCIFVIVYYTVALYCQESRQTKLACGIVVQLYFNCIIRQTIQYSRKKVLDSQLGSLLLLKIKE